MGLGSHGSQILPACPQRHTVVIMLQSGVYRCPDNALETLGTPTGRPLTDAYSAGFQTDPLPGPNLDIEDCCQREYI